MNLLISFLSFSLLGIHNLHGVFCSSLYLVDLNNDTQNLPLLKNDTGDIIEYRNDIEIYKKNKKNYKFWDLIRK